MKLHTLYKNQTLKAIMDTGLPHYTSDIDFIVVKYNDVWMPYNKLREIKAFSHLPAQEEF